MVDMEIGIYCPRFVVARKTFVTGVEKKVTIPYKKNKSSRDGILQCKFANKSDGRA